MQFRPCAPTYSATWPQLSSPTRMWENGDRFSKTWSKSSNRSAWSLQWVLLCVQVFLLCFFLNIIFYAVCNATVNEWSSKVLNCLRQVINYYVPISLCRPLWWGWAIYEDDSQQIFFLYGLPVKISV